MKIKLIETESRIGFQGLRTGRNRVKLEKWYNLSALRWIRSENLMCNMVTKVFKKTEVCTVVPKTPPPWYQPNFLSDIPSHHPPLLSSPIQPEWPPCCSSNILGELLPQGLWRNLQHSLSNICVPHSSLLSGLFTQEPLSLGHMYMKLMMLSSLFWSVFKIFH